MSVCGMVRKGRSFLPVVGLYKKIRFILSCKGFAGEKSGKFWSGKKKNPTTFRWLGWLGGKYSYP
jgi:hypothetical protein